MVKRKILSKITAIFLILCVSVGLVAGCNNLEKSDSNEVRVIAEKYKDIKIVEDKVSVYLTQEVSWERINEKYDIENFNEIECVRVEETTFEQTIAAAQKKLKGEELSEKEEESIKDFKRSFRIYLAQEGRENVFKAIVKLEKREDIEKAEAIGMMHTCATVSDPYRTNQWGLDKIEINDAWDVTTGSPTVLVGVLDTGIDGTHPDLASKLYTPSDPSDTLHRDFTDGSTNGTTVVTPTDPNGHGTHVAGIIAAQANNAGVAGTAYNIKLVSLRVLNNTGYGDPINIQNAIIYADSIGLPILNLSLVGPDNSGLSSAVANFSGIMICAAGNSNANIDNNKIYPASYDFDNIITVGASNSSDGLSVFGYQGCSVNASNYGSTSVDLFAPGSDILSTYPIDLCGEFCIGDGHYAYGYHYMSGTSMATPFVTGVAALLLSKYPLMTAAQIKDHILNTVDSVSALSGSCVTGGRLNAYNALNCTFTVSNSYDDDYHNMLCSICNEIHKRSSHSFVFRNLGEHVGHGRTCRECGHVASVEFHTWIFKVAQNRFVCKFCNATSNSGWSPVKNEDVA